MYQLHRIDPKVPVEESVGVLADMQREGKIRHIGLSEVTSAEIEEAGKTARIVSVQNKYNIGDRAHEATLDYCEKNQLAFIPWFPVAAGKLTEPGGALERFAQKHGASAAQLCIAWLLHRSPVMLPIPGTSTVKHLEENLQAARLKLENSEWKQVEDAVKS